MSRFINILRKSLRPDTFKFRGGVVQTLPMHPRFPPISARYFGADAHHGSGKDEPFLDPKQVTERVISVIKNFEKVTAAKVTDVARFKEDLDLDSLDAVEVVMAIEEEFCIEIPDSEADKILSIADAVAYVSAHPMAK